MLKTKHCRSKSKHNCFGLGYITSIFSVFAIAIVCVGMMSGIASGGNGNGIPEQLDAVMEVLADFESRVEEIADEIETSASSGIADLQDAVTSNTDSAEMAILDNLDEAEDAIIANTDAAEDSVNQFIRDTHLVDPFDVAVSVCTQISGGGVIEGSAGLEIPASIEGSIGAEFFGSGAKIKFEPTGAIGAGIGLSSDVGTSVEACINGVFTRQVQDMDEEAAIIAAAPASEQGFITELIEIGNNYRGRISGTAEATNLVNVNSSSSFDRLNSSLDAFEGVTTLNASLLGQFIVSSFDGTDASSPLGDLVGDLCDSGNGMDSVLGDLAGMVNLTSSSFTDIATSIADSITALGLGSDASGLDALKDLLDFADFVISFEDMVDVLSDIETTLNNVL